MGSSQQLVSYKVKNQLIPQEKLACRNQQCCSVPVWCWPDSGREMFFWVNHLFHSLHQGTLGQSPFSSIDRLEVTLGVRICGIITVSEEDTPNREIVSFKNNYEQGYQASFTTRWANFNWQHGEVVGISVSKDASPNKRWMTFYMTTNVRIVAFSPLIILCYLVYFHYIAFMLLLSKSLIIKQQTLKSCVNIM